MSIILYATLCLMNIACLCAPVPADYLWVNVVAGVICGGAFGWEVVGWATRK